MSKIEVKLIDSMGDDFKTVAGTARVSFGKSAEDYTDEQNIKLVKYLARNSHWTPACSLQAILSIKLPLAIHAQLVTHKQGGVINTMSRRYVRSELEFYEPSFRHAPDRSVKQGSGDLMANQDRPLIYHDRAVTAALGTFNKMLELGVCPEQARYYLPQNLMTKCTVVGSLPYFARIYKQRACSHAQGGDVEGGEWRTITEQMDAIFSELWPVTWSVSKGDE